MARRLSLLPVLLLVAAFLPTCRGPRSLSESPSAPPPDPTVPTPRPAPENSEASQLLEEMAREVADRHMASRQATAIARRQMGELRYREALEPLKAALRLDAENQEARELLHQALFALGERKHEIREVTRELANEEIVRRQLRATELLRLHEEGQRLSAAGKHAEAKRVFRRLLESLDSLE